MSTLIATHDSIDRRLPNGMIAIALFLVTEAMFFLGLISAYLVLRAGVPEWPPTDQPRLPILTTGLNTLFLLASAWTVYRAGVSAARRTKTTRAWLLGTALLGLTFVSLQGAEWTRLIAYGLTTRSSLYGATFYTLIGAHALHVLFGLSILGWLMLFRTRGGIATDPVAIRVGRAYWWFVVGVWPALYLLVYVL